MVQFTEDVNSPECDSVRYDVPGKITVDVDNPKCDNEKDGARSLNDTMASSDRYMVYVVWR